MTDSGAFHGVARKLGGDLKGSTENRQAHFISDI